MHSFRRGAIIKASEKASEQADCGKGVHMRKLSVALALALTLVTALCVPTLAEGDYIAAEHTASNGLPYYLMVNRACNTVTVYTLDGNGYYTVPCKAMVCSTGRAGHATPRGTYRIGNQNRWGYMFDGSWGQYTSGIYGNYLFHSVCYRAKDPSTLMTEEYNLLGKAASLGCVRLQVADAKWIYENCAQGTYVTIYDGTVPGALGKPETAVCTITPEMDNGWEPTDPDEANPWRALFADGEPLPFDDLIPGAWYYPALRWAWEKGMLAETEPRRLSPEAAVTGAEAAEALSALAAQEGLTAFLPATSGEDGYSALTRQELAVLLYRYESEKRGGKPGPAAPLAGYGDIDEIDRSALDAMCWAVESGLIRGMDGGTLAPAAPLSRVQLAVILYRYGNDGVLT